MDVIAIDPGETTGWALFRPEDGAFNSGQVEGRHAFVDFFDSVLSNRKVAVVVMEAYIITPETVKKSRQYDPLYLIGYVEQAARKRGYDFVLQTPAQAKAFADDRKLKALTWYTPTPGGHANDAARHLLTALVARRLLGGDSPLLDRLVEALDLV